MTSDEFRVLIEQGNVEGIANALESNPGLANEIIRWHLNQDNESDPLHYVSDCVGHGWLTNGTDGQIAELLLEHGGALNGNDGQESPLIAAASLGAENAAKVLIDAGAELEATTIFDSRALHWAAWTGAATTVDGLVSRGAKIEPKDSEFGATPLFWAVHGYGPKGPKHKQEQVRAAKILIDAGATVETSNKHGLSALELSKQCARADMYELLSRYCSA